MVGKESRGDPEHHTFMKLCRGSESVLELSRRQSLVSNHIGYTRWGTAYLAYGVLVYRTIILMHHMLPGLSRALLGPGLRVPLGFGNLDSIISKWKEIWTLRYPKWTDGVSLWQNFTYPSKPLSEVVNPLLFAGPASLG